VIVAVVPPNARKQAVSVLTWMNLVVDSQPEVVLIADVTLMAKLCSRRAPLPMNGHWTGVPNESGVLKVANSEI